MNSSFVKLSWDSTWLDQNSTRLHSWSRIPIRSLKWHTVTWISLTQLTYKIKKLSHDEISIFNMKWSFTSAIGLWRSVRNWGFDAQFSLFDLITLMLYYVSNEQNEPKKKGSRIYYWTMISTCLCLELKILNLLTLLMLYMSFCTLITI